MQVEWRETSSLIPYARNARTHSDDQVQQVAASIKEFGWTNPILVDGDNGIIAGHGRLYAAQKLGHEEVPVIELANMTEAQKRAYVIADNKLAENAGWDNDMLALELGELSEQDFDLSLLGFDDQALNSLLALNDATEEGNTDEDDTPEVAEEAVTVTGDTWLLGKHRVRCGTAPALMMWRSCSTALSRT